MNWSDVLTTQSYSPTSSEDSADLRSDQGIEEFPGINKRKLPTWIYVVFTVACLAVDLFVMVSNAILVTACWRTRSLRTLSNLYVISLAGSDMLQAIGMVLQACYYANIWTGAAMWTDFLCPWIYAVFLTSVPISIMNVALIAVDRYVYIIYPYRYPDIITARRSKVVIALAWLCWLVFGFSLVTHPKPNPSSAPALGGITLASLRLMKTFFLVYVSQLVCWLPALIVMTVNATGNSPWDQSNYFILLAELNAAINVMVYVFSNSQFRKAILKLLKCHSTIDLVS